jgi:Tfp pilus assembly protein PilN
MQSINLIPEQEVQEQTKSFVVKLSTVVTIILLVLMAVLSGVLFYRTTKLKSTLTSLASEIDAYRASITALSPVEISARNLDKKYSTIKEILATRSMYSLLASELAARIPSGIAISSFTIQKGTTIGLTGFADNYLTISQFTNDLLDANYEGGKPELKKLFTAVMLNSVQLERARNQVTFSIEVTFNPEILKGK